MQRVITSIIIIISVLAAMLVVVGCTTPTDDEEPIGAEEFYEGKNLRLIVPFSPGGGVDTQVRIFGPYLGEHLGVSNVVIENMQGAGGIIADNYMYTTAEPDGLTLSTSFGDQMMLRQLLGAEGVQYDITEYEWIGRWFSDVQALAVANELADLTVEDLKELPQFYLGGQAIISPMALNSATFLNALDFENAKLVPGYDGLAEINLAIGQGELQAFVTDLSVLQMYAQEEGFVTVYCVLTEERAANAPELPTVYELAEQAGIEMTEEKELYLEMGRAGVILRRAMFAPPNTPQDRVDFLRDAFREAVNDPDFQAEWQAVGFPLEGSGWGDDLQAAAQGLGLTEDQIETLTYLITEKYID